MKIFTVVLLSLILLSVTQVYAQPEEQGVTILALPFENATADKIQDGLKNGIPDILTAFLSPYSDKIKCVDRRSLENIYQEQSLDLQGWIAQDYGFAMGKMLQAQYVMRGSYQKEKGQLSVSVFLYDTETTQLVKSFSADAQTQSLPRVCEKLAHDISRYLKVSVKKIENLPVDEDPVKSALLIEGLGFYYNGQYPSALAQFIKVVQMDENDESAAYWLAKTYQQSGRADHAVIEYESFLKRFPQSRKQEEVDNILVELRK
jgi:TolB-like protein